MKNFKTVAAKVEAAEAKQNAHRAKLEDLKNQLTEVTTAAETALKADNEVEYDAQLQRKLFLQAKLEGYKTLPEYPFTEAETMEIIGEIRTELHDRSNAATAKAIEYLRRARECYTDIPQLLEEGRTLAEKAVGLCEIELPAITAQVNDTRVLGNISTINNLIRQMEA